MHIKNFTLIHFIQFICFIFIPFISHSQSIFCDATTLEDFFNCYGGESTFSIHSKKAVSTFIQAEDACQTGNYNEAKILIDNLFNSYQRGNDIWWNVFNDPNGANIGTPHAYYGLRMLEDIIDHGLNGPPIAEAKKVKMKVVIVGSSVGIQPTTEIELLNGTGSIVTHNIDPKIKEENYLIVKQSINLFSKYVTAITHGKLELEVEFIELNSLNLPVKVTTTRPYLAYDNIEPVWDVLSDETKNNTDWWWILYPSHVPDFPIFDDEAFITGGMGSDSKGGPVFIIDDKWIVRKPAHLGNGNYSDIERRIYLPQWLQHEFFHHLYRIYPELKLEVNGHDWFDLNFWPTDFEGQFETDYYSETLHKRLQINCNALSTKLITRVQDDLAAQYSKISIEELIGPYSLEVIQNPWHEGNIIQENGEYFWKNKANVKWKITPNFSEGKLVTGNDSPYPGQDFFIQLYQTSEGDFVPGAVALKYQGDFYKKKFNLIREIIPMEITLGVFERVPNLNTQHIGNIIKTDGKLYWQNVAGDNWSLTSNVQDEYLYLNTDSPTPNEKFQLILYETDCETYALGFKYLNYYYWKSKRSLSNETPMLKNELPDLVLDKNFGSYSINLIEMFEDSEGDSLLIFASSEDTALISIDIIGQQLYLSGNEVGNTTIYIMALDGNGGLAVDEFNLQVKEVVSTIDVKTNISVYPSLTQDLVNVNGVTDDHSISIMSVDKSYEETIPVTSNNVKFDLRHLPYGMYLLKIKDQKNRSIKVEKIFKF